jgi:hypothetical protein
MEVPSDIARANGKPKHTRPGACHRNVVEKVEISAPLPEAFPTPKPKGSRQVLSDGRTRSLRDVEVNDARPHMRTA